MIPINPCYFTILYFSGVSNRPLLIKCSLRMRYEEDSRKVDETRWDEQSQLCTPVCFHTTPHHPRSSTQLHSSSCDCGGRTWECVGMRCWSSSHPCLRRSNVMPQRMSWRNTVQSNAIVACRLHVYLFLSFSLCAYLFLSFSLSLSLSLSYTLFRLYHGHRRGAIVKSSWVWHRKAVVGQERVIFRLLWLVVTSCARPPALGGSFSVSAFSIVVFSF